MAWVGIISLLGLVASGIGFGWYRFRAKAHAHSHEQHVADELAFLKDDLGLNPGEPVGGVEDFLRLTDAINCSSYIDDHDRDALIAAAEREFFET